MNMDKNSLLAVVACFVFFFAYQTYMSNKYPNLNQDNAEQQVAEVPKAQSEASSAPETAPSPAAAQSESPLPQPAAVKPIDVVQLSEKDLTIETDNAIFQFNQDLSMLMRVTLKKYHETAGTKDQFVDVLTSPMKLQGVTNFSQPNGYRGFTGRREGHSLIFSRTEGPWLIEQKLTVPNDGYNILVDLSFKNTTTVAQNLMAGFLVQENLSFSSGGGFSFGPGAMASQRKTFVYGVDGDRDYEDAKGICEDDDVKKVDSFSLTNEKIDFMGFDMHYFLAVFKPELPKMSAFMQKSEPTVGGLCHMSLVTYQPMGMISGGETAKISFKGFIGPKDVEVLAAHDEAFAKTLNFKSLGMDLSFLARPLLAAIKYFHSIIPNYGVAIILLTLCLKILFYPLTRAAAISMKKMQKLQPEMNKIKEKYAKDPHKQQQELMKFMTANKANPMKGCLPILPQMPVFFAFYSVLSQAIELRHAEFFGWIMDLSSKDPYFVTPLILGGLMFLQQRLTPNPGMDPNQQKVMMMMPLIFTVMMISLPAGLVLYMVVNTVVSIVQQQWLNKKLSNLEFKVVRA